MKIVVLAGGISGERNVSLSSGVLICQALREQGYQVALVDSYLGLEGRETDGTALFDAPVPAAWKTIASQEPDLEEVRSSRQWPGRSELGQGVLELCAQADITFLALHGGSGEDGRLQATLDVMGIPYTGSGALASGIAMDKHLTKVLAGQAGVNTPAWETVDYQESDIPSIVERTALPCVVKPVSCGSSIGVSIAHTAEDLENALHSVLAFGSRVVLEQYISGREIQVAILEDTALPSIEIIPKEGFYDYESKYRPGASEEITPAPIPPSWEERLRRDALTVFHAVGLSVYARADFIVTADGTPWFLEINNLPGMTLTSLVPQEAAAAGISYGELCRRIVLASMQEKRG